MTWTPWAILAGLVLEAISAWIARHAVHPEPYEAMRPFRFCHWGTLPEPHHRPWFFAMKLPIYQWNLVDYGRRQGWLQLHLVWIEHEGWGRSGYYHFL